MPDPTLVPVPTIAAFEGDLPGWASVIFWLVFGVIVIVFILWMLKSIGFSD